MAHQIRGISKGAAEDQANGHEKEACTKHLKNSHLSHVSRLVLTFFCYVAIFGLDHSACILAKRDGDPNGRP